MKLVYLTKVNTALKLVKEIYSNASSMFKTKPETKPDPKGVYPKVRDDICIDIETLGIGVDATIVMIGASVFNRFDKPGTIKASFERKIDLTSSPARALDTSTVMWWLEGDKAEARDAVFSPKDRVSLEDALKELKEFINTSNIDKAFACGPDFDLKILNHAYIQCGQSEFPIPFWNWGCVRTLEQAFYGKNTRKEGGLNAVSGIAHDPLADIEAEVRVVQNTLQAAYDCGMHKL